MSTGLCAPASPGTTPRMESPSDGGPAPTSAILVRDLHGWIPLSSFMSEGDPLVLLTPVVMPFNMTGTGRAAAAGEAPGSPAGAPSQDPFEALGRALATQPLRPKVHHVPYTAKGGLGQTHVEIIQMARARAVIFVISGPPSRGQASQVEIAGTLRDVAGDRPQLILACCSVRDLGRLETSFPTIVQIPSYSQHALESAAALLSRGKPPHQLQQILQHPHALLSPRGQQRSLPQAQSPSQSQPQAPTPTPAPAPSPAAVTPHRHHSPHQSQQPHHHHQQRSSANVQNLVMAPREWRVESFVMQRDIQVVHKLWNQTLGDQYALSPFTLQSLLTRDGYAMHYVVREPETDAVIGFCATYTTYVNSGEERLVGSVAALLVRSEYRRRGVGLSLHNYALAQLKRTRGVFRLQLGSTFPRLLLGPPIGLPSEEWFRRRGWELGRGTPGQGQEVCDWLLRFKEYPGRALAASSGLRFRPCEPQEYAMVLELVARESQRNDSSMGWYDQYTPLSHTQYIKDIIIGTAGDTVVAAALTYLPHSESPVAKDLPWAATIPDRIGGVTCICIEDDTPGINVSRDAMMIRLLDACVKHLQEQDMSGMLLDAVKGGDEGFQVMGFQKWASYRDTWRPA